MDRPRLQFSLFTIMLSVTFVAVFLSLHINVGDGAAFMALFPAQLGIYAIP